MTPTWAQRREVLWRDCIVSPDVFTSMVERLGDFVVPYQRALETEASQRNVHLYLQGLLSHLPRKNAEDIATFVDVERQVLQDFLGTTPWDHRPLIKVLVAHVIEGLGEPDGAIAFGRCFKGVDPRLESDSKLVPIDKEANHQIVHRCRFGKAPIRRLLSRGKTSPLRNFWLLFPVAFHLTSSTPDVWPQTLPCFLACGVGRVGAAPSTHRDQGF